MRKARGNWIPENTVQRLLARSEQQDFEIMKARCLAAKRGARPADVQRNIRKLEEK